MKIYTKFGDQGKTRLVGGSSVDKSDPRVDCYGTLDELNSFIGVAISHLTHDNSESALQELRSELQRLQHELFNLGSLMACNQPEMLAQLPQIQPSHVELLEKSIDRMTKELEPLKNFILPGGSPLSAHLHVCRTVSRRAERGTVQLSYLLSQTETADAREQMFFAQALVYLNRMSDYFFTAARFANLKLKTADEIWHK